MSKWFLAIGTVLGLLTTMLIYRHIDQIQAKQVSIEYIRLKPNESIAKDGMVKLSQLNIVTLPEGKGFESLAKVAISHTQDNVDWIKGRASTRDIPAGSFLLYEYFADEPSSRFAYRIHKDRRAMTIKVNQTSAVGYFIEPGSRVDILGTVSKTEIIPATNKPSISKQDDLKNLDVNRQTTVVTKTLQQNVRVLAVGPYTTRNSYLRGKRSYSSITIELTPQDAEKLVFAQKHLADGFTLVLRNPENTSAEKIPSVSWDALN